MKGIDQAVTIMIVVVIGFIVIMVAYFMLAPITGVASAQQASATLTTCCSRFVLDNMCTKDSTGNYVNFEDIDCTVDKSIDKSGLMKLTVLAGKSGYPATKEGAQKACCK